MRKFEVALGFGAIDGANCLNACDTPPCAADLPHGTYSYYAVTALFPAGLLPGTRLLVMQP